MRQKQGFYVYRNRRLIIWGTWFRLVKQHELNKLARVRVDIPNSLDAIWDIDVKKSTASLPDVIKKNLIAIVKNAVGRSERVYRYRGRQVCNDDLEHVWDTIDNRGSIQYQVNRETPLFKKVESYLNDEGGQYLDSLIKLIEDAFPYGDVYYRIAKNEANAQTASLGFDDAYQIASDMLSSIKSMDGDVQAFLASLDKMDFFIKYPDVVLRIREENSIDK